MYFPLKSYDYRPQGRRSIGRPKKPLERATITLETERIKGSNPWSLWRWCMYFRWSRGSVLAFSTQVCGFKPGRIRRIFKGEKILRTPSFGGEVKPSVPCRRFAACKRSLNGKITGQHSHPQFPLPPLGSLTSWRTWRHLVVKSGNI